MLTVDLLLHQLSRRQLETLVADIDAPHAARNRHNATEGGMVFEMFSTVAVELVGVVGDDLVQIGAEGYEYRG